VRSSRATHLIGVAAALLNACAFRETEPRQLPGDVVFELGDGEYAREQCILSAVNVTNGAFVYQLGRFARFPSGNSAAGPFYGISGAPIIDEAGSVIGACSQTFWGATAPTFGVLPARSFDTLLKLGRLYAMPRCEAQNAPLGENLQVGSAVAVAAVWGDVIRAITGYVFEVTDQNEVLCLGHSAFGRQRGPRVLALL